MRSNKYESVKSAMRQQLGQLSGLAFLTCFMMIFSMIWVPLPSVQASAPASGSIGATGPAISWTGNAVGTGAANETVCVEGVNCDTFTLNVQPGDYTNKVISIRIEWAIQANDYDLYIHKDSNTGTAIGSSADGAPQTSESASINPNSTGTGVYTVHVLYFAVTPLVDQYRGTATIQSQVPTRSANYVKGGITFSANNTVKAPSAGRDGEPSSRTDFLGNHYVGGIRGVPAGVDLWYFDLRPGSPSYDPFMRHPLYRGQIDSFTEEDSTSVGADGGGDIDLAVGFRDPVTGISNDPPTLAASSLVVANISTQRSTDRGITMVNNPVGNITGGLPGDDRQWQEFYGKDKVYILYRTAAPAVTMIQRSNDGGFTYGPARTAGAIGQVGSIDVHQASGTVYISGSTGQVCVGTPPPFPAPAGSEPLTYTCSQAASDPNGVAHIFFSVKVADDGTPFGTAYVAYSNDHDVFLVSSSDKGATWSQPVRVSDGTETRTSLFPWLETGPTPGSVGIAWYGTAEPTNNNDSNWNVFFAQSFNATAATPTFRQVKVSDHFIHGSNISEGGLDATGQGANRNLIDYFQISFDPTGAAVVDYADDHNDFDGHTYVSRQISGPSIRGGSVPAPVEGPGPFAPGLNPAPSVPGPNGEQVTDFAGDHVVGLLAHPGGTSPFDVTSIKYSCEGSTEPVIVATMKVSDLSVVPPAGNWRMNFAANAPDSVLSARGDYTFALSDRGDQFWVRASTDTTGVPTYTYGTAVRNGNGSIGYTERGAADSGAFNSSSGTLTIKVAASKLNPFVTHGPAIAYGSVLAGLRGEAFTSEVNAITDDTRGGTLYTVGCGAASPSPTPTGTPSPSPTPTPGPTPAPGAVFKVTGNGSILGKVVNFGLKVDEIPSGRLNYQDDEMDIHLVSDTIDTYSYDPSRNEITFTGHGHVDRDAVFFTVTIRDNGESGFTDTFSITITGSRTSSRSGTLSNGNIQFHR